MSSEQEINAKLEELKPIYNQLVKDQKAWQKLQLIEPALADYHEELAAAEKELKEIQERQQNLITARRTLERKKRRLHQPSVASPTATSQNLTLDPFEAANSPKLNQPSTPSVPQISPRPPEEILAIRHSLQKQIGRWARTRLDPGVLGEINRIALDIERPLGEALIMLDWDTYFMEPLHRRETPEARLKRLNEWGGELIEYRNRLQGDIDRHHTRYRRVLPIWEMWLSRDRDEAGQTAW